MNSKNYHHGDLKQQMILNGLKLLNEQGVQGLSLRKIASMCNVSHAAPYKHFKDKEDLISQISNHVKHEFDLSITNSIDDNLNPKDKMIQVAKGYIGFMNQNPEYFKFLMCNAQLFSVRITEDDITCEDSHAFDIFKENSLEMFKYLGIDEKEYAMNILTMWATVQGMSMLIANQNLLCEDYDELLEKMLRQKLNF